MKLITANLVNDLKDLSQEAIDAIPEADAKIVKLIQTMPMSKWAGSSRGIATFEDGAFTFGVEIAPEHEEILFTWVQEICAFRLSRYFALKGRAVH